MAVSEDRAKVEIIMHGIVLCVGFMSAAAVFVTMFWVLGGGNCS